MQPSAKQLSEHFTLAELTHSDIAIRLGILNAPGEAEIENLKQLCIHVLEPLRCHLAKPVRVSSGFRCPELNKKVKGAKRSQHLLGQAADIRVDDVDSKTLWGIIKALELPIDECILEYWDEAHSERSWVHVSYGPKHQRKFFQIG